MSVRYICTQCEQLFLIDDDADGAVKCEFCAGMAFPAADEGEPYGLAVERSQSPKAQSLRELDIHDQDTGILPDPYRENTEVLPSRDLDPGSDVGPQALEEEGSGEFRSSIEDSQSDPSEESGPYYVPNEQSASKLRGPALPASLWHTDESQLYESEPPSAAVDAETDHAYHDETALFQSEDFEQQAIDVFDQAFNPVATPGLEDGTPDDDAEDEQERTDPALAPYALHRPESSDLHLTLSAEAQAIAGISLDSASESSGRPIGDDDTERLPRARREVSAANSARNASWEPPRRQGPAPVEVPGPVVREEGPQLASPNYALPVRSRLLAVAAACFALGIGLGFVKTPVPIDARSRLVKDAEAKLIDGNRAYADKEFDSALGYYRSALALQPNYPEALYARAMVLARQQRFEEAAKAYREYIEFAPNGLYADEVRKELSAYEAK